MCTDYSLAPDFKILTILQNGRLSTRMLQSSLAIFIYAPSPLCCRVSTIDTLQDKPWHLVIIHCTLSTDRCSSPTSQERRIDLMRNAASVPTYTPTTSRFPVSTKHKGTMTRMDMSSRSGSIVEGASGIAQCHSSDWDRLLSRVSVGCTC